MEADKTYPLPLVIIPAFTFKLMIGLFLLGAMFCATSLMPVDEMEGSILLNTFIFYIFFPLMGFLLILAPIYQNIFKKHRITITEHNIKLKSLFVNKEILWENVVDISEYSLNKNDFVGFVTKAKLKTFAKGGLGASLNANFGGLNEISIPLKQLGKLDRDKVINTIKARFMQQDAVEAEALLIDLDINSDGAARTNRFKALSLSILLTIASALAYSFSIYFFEINILIIPLISIFIISFYYGKYVQISDYNLFDKLWLSFLGLVSILAAKVVLIFLFNDITPSLLNIVLMAYVYLVERLPNDWSGEFIWISITVVVVVIGFRFGPPLNLFKQTQNQDV